MKNSELRHDIVSGDWIIIAPGRLKRSSQFIKKPVKRKKVPKRGCPFEKIGSASNHEPILVLKKGNDWKVQILENKYPALAQINHGFDVKKMGLYETGNGFGHHDLIITRDHNKNFPDLSKDDQLLLLESLRDRYLMILDDPYIEYVSIFQNFGPKAGASVYHPHYQMLSLPVLPADITRSLNGSLSYYKKNKKCVHCAIIAWELKKKYRVVYQNEFAVAVCPYFSKTPFEVRIFPKQHLPYFENTLDRDLEGIADVLKKALLALRKNLFDPDYNLFIHSAPLKEKSKHSHYHWHIEILPKVTTWGGFELSSGVEINPIDPDEAARVLRR